MKKLKLKSTLLFSTVSLASFTTFLSASCGSKQDENTYSSKFNLRKTDYDLGLVSEPINSLNYIKFASLGKVLPSLVESPLKGGPNANLKKLLNLPEIKFGIYGSDSTSNSMEEFLENHAPAESNSSRFYGLDQFGATTGNISTDATNYYPVSGVFTNNNNVLSLNILLNDGNSKWSNGDEVLAEDYLDALHYILDLNTGSQNQTHILQSKLKASSEIIDAQQIYQNHFKKSYKNPFAYPDLIKDKNGKLIYDVFNENYVPWGSQSENDFNEVEAIKKAALDLGMYSGRLYWNYSNKEILSSIPYSPDFDPEAEITVVMLPNPEYSKTLHTEEELKNIPQRVATKIRKYLYHDPRQKYNDLFKNELLKQSRRLKSALSKDISYNENNVDAYNKAVNDLYKGKDVLKTDDILNFDAKKYMENRVLALDEYSIRYEYNQFQPASLSNVYRDLNSTFVPVNRKFVESIGGITEFGLDGSKFLTNGAFKIVDLVLGRQGYILLGKNKQYYSSDKTVSNRIKIYFSDDPNINSAMYDDGYIAATKIPPVQQLNYWASKNYRKYMKKSSGYGTIGLAFNLDKTTNGNSLLQDQYLRNAIYYAIDRNAMLSIVGWNSSYPVITWTAFGNAASSFGDPLELAFDHDESYVQIFDKNTHKPVLFSENTNAYTSPEAIDGKKPNYAIPVENYKHVDHLAKAYNFEHVDRTDKAYRLDIARQYLAAFRARHPKVEKVNLRYISNSTDEQQNAGLALQDLMKKAFGGFIEIEIKGLPQNVYEDARTTGKNYDLLYKNFDTFGSDVYSYVNVFLKPDGINKDKTTGFRNNPVGSWIYENYFSQYGYKYDASAKKVVTDKPLEADSLRQRLRIEPDVWNKVLELAFKTDKETLNDYTQRYSAFFSNQFTKKEVAEKWTEKRVFSVVAALEKVIRDAAPVVPLMEVDTYWEISRVNGVESLFTYSLQFAYDVAKPPKASLPTVIKDSD